MLQQTLQNWQLTFVKSNANTPNRMAFIENANREWRNIARCCCRRTYINHILLPPGQVLLTMSPCTLFHQQQNYYFIILPTRYTSYRGTVARRDVLTYETELTRTVPNTGLKVTCFRA
jgi:hypothetical protein